MDERAVYKAIGSKHDLLIIGRKKYRIYVLYVYTNSQYVARLIKGAYIKQNREYVTIKSAIERAKARGLHIHRKCFNVVDVLQP